MDPLEEVVNVDPVGYCVGDTVGLFVTLTEDEEVKSSNTVKNICRKSIFLNI